MANDLYHLGVRPEQLRRDLGDCPEMLTAVIDEATEMLGKNDGLETAMDYANLMIGELERVCNVSGDVERDDYEVVRKVMKDGTVREVKKKVSGNNVKELVRKMRFSLPLTKLIATDSSIREYLLYCALHI